MRKLLYIPYTILLTIDWFLTVLSNVLEVICKAIQEISLVLENALKPNGKTKLTIPSSSDSASHEGEY